MRIFNKSLAVAACVAAVTFGAVAPPAHAGVTFYSDANFLGSVCTPGITLIWVG